MTWQRGRTWVLVVPWLALGTSVVVGVEPTGGVTIRAIRPDRQLEEVLGLFRGARSPHPAAALAAWKRGTRTAGAGGLGKPAEAAIAALNPAMVRELRGLDEARVGLGLDPTDGRVRWYLVAPQDDGSLEALVTATVLTDGGADPPFQGIAVDRLGGAGSALSARVPGVFTLAGGREDLAEAVRQAGADVTVRPDVESGWIVRIDPSQLEVAGDVPRRRLIEGLRASGRVEIEAVLGMAGEDATATVTSRGDGRAAAVALERSWLDWIPATGTAAALALAIDPRPSARDAAFAWADRVERADPSRAEVAPLRTRLNLLAAAAGVRPEADLWPVVRGISVSLAWDPGGDLRGIVVALHVADEAAAETLAGSFFPKLAAAFVKKGEGPGGEKGLDVRSLGSAGGKPVEIARQGATVVLGWGPSMVRAALASRADPARSASSTIGRGWDAKAPPRRAGAFWPGRIDLKGLDEAPPVVWRGWDEGGTTRDVVRWEGLRDVVRRFLERLPLDPPPDR